MSAVDPQVKPSGGATPAETIAPAEAAVPSSQDARLRAKNRLYLIVITLICLVIAAGGYAFARWMAQQPPTRP